jgi:Na+/H+ antiporter NhaD/arsenite permease-like protein
MDNALTNAIIFIVFYLIIASEKINKTTAAIASGFLVVFFHLIDFTEAVRFIDFNVIFLLIGMMIIVNITGKTGVFQWLAIKSAKMAKGDPVKILIMFSLITAIISALLDNVTVIILIVPVTMMVTHILKLNPVPFVVSEVFASNIGGTATLIGDPPNIIIGSYLNLTFLDFIVNLMPGVIVVLGVYILVIWLFFRKKMFASQKDKTKVFSIRENLIISDTKFLKKCLIVLGIVLFLFLIHAYIDVEPSVIAMLGAAALLIVTGESVSDVLKNIEWETIFFFIGLFMLVGSLVESGAIGVLADFVTGLTRGSVFSATGIVLWMSAIISGLVDNIPYVATMLPLIEDLNQQMPVLMQYGMEQNPVVWALALGTCFGGNATIIGATANVIAFGMLKKEGLGVTFWEYIKYGLPLMVLTVVIAHIYVYFMFLRLFAN